MKRGKYFSGFTGYKGQTFLGGRKSAQKDRFGHRIPEYTEAHNILGNKPVGRFTKHTAFIQMDKKLDN